MRNKVKAIVARCRELEGSWPKLRWEKSAGARSQKVCYRVDGRFGFILSDFLGRCYAGE